MGLGAAPLRLRSEAPLSGNDKHLTTECIAQIHAYLGAEVTTA
jgi:hypothetical protein